MAITCDITKISWEITLWADCSYGKARESCSQTYIRPNCERRRRRLSGNWWKAILPNVDPRLLMCSNQEKPPNPARIFSGAAGVGSLASLAFFGQPRAPSRLYSLAADTNKIHIFGLFAVVATVCQPRDELWGRKVPLLVDVGAPCAAVTGGAAKNEAVMTLVYTLRAVATRYDVAFRLERGPTKANPACPPPR